MKIVIFLLLSILLFSQNISWQGDYNKALALAKKENKKLIVLIVKRDKLSTKVIKRFNKQKGINNKYIFYLGLFDTNYPIELYYTTKFPTLFIVEPKNEIFIYKPLYKEEILKQSTFVLNQ